MHRHFSFKLSQGYGVLKSNTSGHHFVWIIMFVLNEGHNWGCFVIFRLYSFSNLFMNWLSAWMYCRCGSYAMTATIQLKSFFTLSDTSVATAIPTTLEQSLHLRYFLNRLFLCAYRLQGEKSWAGPWCIHIFMCYLEYHSGKFFTYSKMFRGAWVHCLTSYSVITIPDKIYQTLENYHVQVIALIVVQYVVS